MTDLKSPAQAGQHSSPGRPKMRVALLGKRRLSPSCGSRRRVHLSLHELAFALYVRGTTLPANPALWQPASCTPDFHLAKSSDGSRFYGNPNCGKSAGTNAGRSEAATR